MWGASATDLKDLKDIKGKPLKPYGLSKIVEKHLDDFSPFEGNSAYEKLGNGLDFLVKNGELISEHGINTIIGKHNQQTYRIGLSKGWNSVSSPR